MLAVFFSSSHLVRGAGSLSRYGAPHDSSAGISSVGYFIALFILGFIVLKVYLALRKDKKNNSNRK